MTEDHRLTSKDERLRLLESGKQLKDGEIRLAGKLSSHGLTLSDVSSCECFNHRSLLLMCLSTVIEEVTGGMDLHVCY